MHLAGTPAGPYRGSMRVVAVYSVKGGVGKTTAAVNLAYEAARDRRVLLWDLDPQGAATFLLDVKPKLRGGAEDLVRGKTPVKKAVKETAWEHLDVLPADASYRELDLVLDAAKKSTQRIEKTLEPLAKAYDLVVLDCPPGASLVAENAVRAADVVVLPLVPAPLSLRSLDQVLEIVKDSPKPAPVLAYLSMVDRRKGAHRAAVEDLPGARTEVVDVVVPAAAVVESMGARLAPLATFAASSPASAAFHELWSRVDATLNGKKSRRR